MQYAQLNELNALEYSVVKYVTRHGTKGNPDSKGLEDINKAIHCLELIKEWVYNER